MNNQELQLQINPSLSTQGSKSVQTELSSHRELTEHSSIFKQAKLLTPLLDVGTFSDPLGQKQLYIIISAKIE